MFCNRTLVLHSNGFCPRATPKDSITVVSNSIILVTVCNSIIRFSKACLYCFRCIVQSVFQLTAPSLTFFGVDLHRIPVPGRNCKGFGIISIQYWLWFTVVLLFACSGLRLGICVVVVRGWLRAHRVFFTNKCVLRSQDNTVCETIPLGV